MMQKHDWLPDMASINGEWDKVLVRLYGIFDKDFRKGKPFLEKLPVWWDRRVEKGDIYEEGFWHLISRDEQRSGERLFDPRRAERLPWCCPMLLHNGDVSIKTWDHREGRLLRTYVWLEEYDYVVVLEKRQQNFGKVAFLITAYHVDGPSRKSSLAKKYAQREG